MNEKREKTRLDVLLAGRGLFPSRKLAQAAVMAGRVFINGQKKEKAGEKFDPHVEIEITEPMPYVGRGALKLEGALMSFDIDPSGMVCLDIGASTGGFTDLLLQRGAEKVYALDVGYGLIASKLRDDERVVVIERFNARHLSESDIPQKVDIVVMDLSFISIRLVMVNILPLLKPAGKVVSLIKPQFEVGRESVGKGGIVRNADPVRAMLNRLKELEPIHNLYLNSLILSPISGTKGNREFFGLFEQEDTGFAGEDFDKKVGELLDEGGFI